MMSSLTDRNLSLAIRALVERNDTAADMVEAEDSQLDQLEVSIDESVVLFIARQRPVAQDLRLMMVITKIANNLERIGDQSVSIARLTKKLNCEPQLKPYVDLQRMANTTTEMLRGAIECFTLINTEHVKAIISQDKVVDDINRQLFRELTSFMLENPATITRSLHLLLVARCLERIADHAKNIAEEVYYLGKAVDIRHTHPGGSLTPPNGA